MKQLSHAQYAELIKAAKAGDTTAFASLYAATVKSQLYFATTFLKDASLAEDAVQEIYLSLYRNLHKIDDGKYFIAYLRRISYNTCVDFVKKKNRDIYELNDTVLQVQQDNDTGANPHEYYDVQEQNSALQQALGTLTEEQRAAFLMRYYNEMKVREIARAMNISESTVKRYVKQATEQLQELLSPSALMG